MIVAIGGEPATGKSTLMKQWMKPYKWEDVKLTDLLYGMWCKDCLLYTSPSPRDR